MANQKYDYIDNTDVPLKAYIYGSGLIISKPSKYI